MSRIYHYIRGQAFIKLYVMFNMLEIFDKLCAALGQVRVEKNKKKERERERERRRRGGGGERRRRR